MPSHRFKRPGSKRVSLSSVTPGFISSDACGLSCCQYQVWLVRTGAGTRDKSLAMRPKRGRLLRCAKCAPAALSQPGGAPACYTQFKHNPIIGMTNSDRSLSRDYRILQPQCSIAEPDMQFYRASWPSRHSCLLENNTGRSISGDRAQFRCPGGWATRVIEDFSRENGSETQT